MVEEQVQIMGSHLMSGRSSDGDREVRLFCMCEWSIEYR